MPLKGKFDFSELENQMNFLKREIQEKNMYLKGCFLPLIKYTFDRGETRQTVKQELLAGCSSESKRASMNTSDLGAKIAKWYTQPYNKQTEVLLWASWVADNANILDVNVKALAQKYNDQSQELLHQFTTYYKNQTR